MVALHCCVIFCCTEKWISYMSTCELCLAAPWCPTLCDPTDCSLPGASVHEGSPGKNTGVGCHGLLQRIFPTQGSNPGLLPCRWILYHLSHQGSPRILEWAAYSRLPWICRRILHWAPLFWISFPFRSPQSMEWSCLCCSIGSHSLSVLYVVSIVYVRQSPSPSSFHPSLYPLGIHSCVLYIYDSISALQTSSPVPLY